ncbi:hypothetical protein C5C10_15560 [Rathayibacter sp. AY1A3]|nr:hypothetical protein C5C10_15560 [Rathayibacter sp. AY1A3]
MSMRGEDRPMTQKSIAGASNANAALITFIVATFVLVGSIFLTTSGDVPLGAVAAVVGIALLIAGFVQMSRMRSSR